MNPIPGFRIGHDTDTENITGCTVVLAPPQGAVGGVVVTGPAPGTRETDLLRTGRLVERVHAVMLSGGSAFGLDAASGVVQYLEEQNIGLDVGVARVPIVPAAVLFDLNIGNPRKRPDAAAGYRASVAAGGGEIAEGSVGAGTGATVGKILGSALATKGGIGYAALQIGAPDAPVQVAALVAVNAFGDVLDAESGMIVAGARNPEGGWLNTALALSSAPPESAARPTNTTIGVVMTDAPLTKEQANLVASMAQSGIARVTRPAPSLYDGDTLFVLASGTGSAVNLTGLGDAAAVCVATAIVRGVKLAVSLGGCKTWNQT